MKANKGLDYYASLAMNKEINNENDNLLLYIQQFLFIYNNFSNTTDNNAKLQIIWIGDLLMTQNRGKQVWYCPNPKSK